MGKGGALKRGTESRNFRRGRRRETLCFIALCMFCLVAVGLADEGNDFLNEKEGQLAQVADALQTNNVQKCALPNACTATHCSRNSCLPEENDVNNYTCMAVSFNKYCNASASGCHDKTHDYTRSFVRTALNTDFNSVLTTIGTCVQRALDPIFKNVSTRESVNRLYFAAIDGSWRSFPGAVQVLAYQNLSDTTYLPELDPLLQSLFKQKSEDLPGTGISDVAKGIGAALLNIAAINLEAAKFILIFMDGKFATARNISIPVTNLTSSNVKVFMYKIPRSNDGMLFLGNTSFANQLCSIGASFEVISSDLSNPLLAINSFFTFTATLHAAVTKNSADYSIIYPVYEQTEGNISTVSRPVFSINKTLLGVVGLDIDIEHLENLTSLVQAAILTRSSGQAFKSQNFVLTDGGCSQLQTASPPATPCPGVNIPQNGGFCYRTDQTNTIQDLACYGSCAKHDRGGVKPGVIAATVVVPV